MINVDTSGGSKIILKYAGKDATYVNVPVLVVGC